MKSNSNTAFNYTAAITETSGGGFMGVVMEVPGATSFARTEDELIVRLMDAVTCIHEANKASSNVMLENALGQKFGQESFKTMMIPCA